MVTSVNKLKFQETIKNEFSVSGIGLHTGQKCNLTFKPAPSNFGIKFKRIDIKAVLLTLFYLKGITIHITWLVNPG